MLNWFTARELAGLPGMPSSERTLQRRGKAEWPSRRRPGTKATEYSFSALPPETQAALLARAIGQDSPEPVASAEAEVVSRDAVSPSRLNDSQRTVMT
ncbi:DNA-binding protein, partial [Pseudomonas aeruginosa]